MLGLSDVTEKYHNVPAAIYGIGTDTERLLPEIEADFDIVGLLDGFRTSGCIYGKRLLSIGELPEKGVKLIIVIARPASCRIIAKRIGNFCGENGIALFDTNGKDLLQKSGAAFSFDKKLGAAKQQLIEAIEQNDVVSVDLFDTLIMRRVLFSEDVIELVNRKLLRDNIAIDDFSKKRIRSEKELACTCEPSLKEIYARLLQDENCESVISAEKLAETEYEIDRSTLVPRAEMLDIISDCFDAGKKVYIVSDTYYTKSQLADILKSCGFSKYTDILASCEYKTRKSERLFECLKSKINGMRCIHIGDDKRCDVESAEKNGLSAFGIYSAAELLEMTGYLGLYEETDNLNSRIKIGLFISRLFNSPFCFEHDKNELSVASDYDIGYLFAAPVISDFVLWLSDKIKETGMERIWFGARDGYLIKELYDILFPGNSSVYFLTSRISAVRAGVESSEDIGYIEDMKFSGTTEQQLEKQFGIKARAGGIYEKGLSDYSSEIIEQAGVYRRNYRKYIDGTDRCGRIAFVDFVAKGTAQMFLSRIADRKLTGFYFLRLEKDYMKERGLEIYEFCGDGELKESVFDNYYLLEPILTSFQSMLNGFDENGEPVYAEETRSGRDISCIRRVHDGVAAYFREYTQLVGTHADIGGYGADGKILALIRKINIGGSDFSKLKVDDPFFNRQTDIKSLL